jgi:hypothetical protein
MERSTRAVNAAQTLRSHAWRVKHFETQQWDEMLTDLLTDLRVLAKEDHLDFTRAVRDSYHAARVVEAKAGATR